MRPVLFVIPLHEWIGQHVAFLSFLPDLPIYGYGLMLFLAFLGCNWLAQRLARLQGYDPRFIPDLAIWLFVAGIAGGRINYVIQNWHTFKDNQWNVIKLWDGGLVLYGAMFGGTFAYFAFDHFVMRKAGISRWKMLDVVAPCVALGVALGRIGCLCTGCCFGNVACPGSPEIHFPYATAPAPQVMVQRGLQTPFGFVFHERTLKVRAVEPGTPAEDAGVKPGDTIVAARLRIPKPKDEGKNKEDSFEEKMERVHSEAELTRFAVVPLELKVARALTEPGGEAEIPLPQFTPTSIGLHPTQIYETISMCLLLFFLLSYFPYRRRDGELLVLLMFCYGVHRYLNEALRTDTAPVAFGLTYSQLVSIGILAFGVVVAYLVWRRPPREEVPPWTAPPVAPPEPTAVTTPTTEVKA